MNQEFAINPLDLQLIEEVREKFEEQAKALRPFMEQVEQQAAEYRRRIQPVLEEMARAKKQMEEARALRTRDDDNRSISAQWMIATRRTHTYSTLDPQDRKAIATEVVSAIKEEILPAIPTADTNTQPSIQLPAGARWDKLVISFRDRQWVSVSYDGEDYGEHDHADLGFARENNDRKEPDKTWKMLELLALGSMDSEFIPIISNLAESLGSTAQACQKTISLLRKKLRKAFGINAEPFQKYDPTEGYRLKARLRLAPILRGNGELYRSGGKLRETDAIEYPFATE